MKSKILLIILFLLFFYLPSHTIATGLLISNEHNQIAPAESRGIIYFDGSTETLFSSVTFNFNALTMWNFGWLIPVPSKPKVELLSKDVFISFDKLLEKNVNNESYQTANIVTRPAFAIQNKVIHLKKDRQELTDWLSEKGYILPKAAYPMLERYAGKGWYLVIIDVDGVHLENNAIDSLTVSAAHTMPVKLTFKTEQPIYPLALTAIQPDNDSQAVPFAFDYGQSSEQVLGEQDSKVDSMLQNQSIRKYPALPLDASYLKTDLFVVSKNRAMAEGFMTDYAEIVNSKELPIYMSKNKKMFLTHLVGYKPMIQLTDVIVQNDKSAHGNSQYSFNEITMGSLLFLVGFGSALLIYRKGK